MQELAADLVVPTDGTKNEVAYALQAVLLVHDHDTADVSTTATRSCTKLATFNATLQDKRVKRWVSWWKELESVLLHWAGPEAQRIADSHPYCGHTFLPRA